MAMNIINKAFSRETKRKIAKWGTVVAAYEILAVIHGLPINLIPVTLWGPVRFGHLIVAMLALTSYWWFDKWFS